MLRPLAGEGDSTIPDGEPARLPRGPGQWVLGADTHLEETDMEEARKRSHCAKC